MPPHATPAGRGLRTSFRSANRRAPHDPKAAPCAPDAELPSARYPPRRWRRKRLPRSRRYGLRHGGSKLAREHADFPMVSRCSDELEQESNLRQQDYKSCALPTELSEELMKGLEPPTSRIQSGRSTPELHMQPDRKRNTKPQSGSRQSEFSESEPELSSGRRGYHPSFDVAKCDRALTECGSSGFELRPRIC